MEANGYQKCAKYWEKEAKKANIEAANLRQQILFLLTVINTAPSVSYALMIIEESKKFDNYFEVLNGN